jgi:uridine kinase
MSGDTPMLPRLMSYAALASILREKRERLDADRPVLVCIDGAGGSGKSTIARELANAADDIQVVAQDDFYRPSVERFSGPPSLCPHGADFDLARLRSEVLEPLRQGRAVEYRVYDWDADALTGVVVPVTKPIVVVEGVYSSSVAQRSLFDVTLWVESPRELRLSRGLARDGEVARARWELDWMPKEDRYIEEEHPHEHAAIVCDGSREDLAAGVLVLGMR